MQSYENPSLDIINATDEEFCADPASVADNLNYKHLNDVTIDLETLEDWDGE